MSFLALDSIFSKIKNGEGVRMSGKCLGSNGIICV